jgi:carboxyvinyl-carboxyphosphonate phosphorylmutase
MRTVEELEAAGISALTIEDTKLPISFGSSGKGELISIGEMVGKLKAGLAGRRDPSMCVIARSVGMPNEGLEKTLERVKAYSATGVDALFFVGIRSMEELTAIHKVTDLPIILGGRAQGMDDVKALVANGVRVALQGHQPFLSTIKTLHEVYEHLAKGGAPGALKDKVASDELVARVTNKPAYDKWIKDYLGS